MIEMDLLKLRVPSALIEHRHAERARVIFFVIAFVELFTVMI